VECLLAYTEWEDSCPSPGRKATANVYLNWWLNAGSVLASVLWRAVSFLEKSKSYAAATVVLRTLLRNHYAPRRRGRWWNRLAVNEGHLRLDPSHIWDTINAGLGDAEVVEGDRLALLNRRARLQAKIQPKPPPCPIDVKLDRIARTEVSVSCGETVVRHHHIIGRSLSKQAGVKSRYIGYDDATVSVEELVLQHFRRSGSEEASFVAGDNDTSSMAALNHGGDFDFNGLHCEGGLLRFLFALLMWECLFAPVPDVFQTPYQDAPLDLTCDIDHRIFYTNREEMIEATLSRYTKMGRRELVERLAATYTKNKGSFCRGCQWKYYPLKHLQCAALCIGGAGLSAICRTLSMNYAYFSAGIPDLFLWRVRRRRRQKTASTNVAVMPAPATGTSTGTSTTSTVQPHTRNAKIDITGATQSKTVTSERKTETETSAAISPLGGGGVTESESEHGEWEVMRLFDEVLPEELRKASEEMEGLDAFLPFEHLDHSDDAGEGSHDDGESYEYRFESKFIEVKSKNDRLAPKQCLWLKILKAASLDASVCHVLETDAEVQRFKAQLSAEEGGGALVSSSAPVLFKSEPVVRDDNANSDDDFEDTY
jgi:hypothetical protein